MIFVGGGMGSAVRFLMGKWINGLHDLQFPLGTLVINVIACLVLGLLVGWTTHRQVLSEDMRLFLTTGFCGGFSTFSAFSQETITLLQGGATANAVLYVGSSLLLCFAASFAGLYFAGQS